MYESSSSAYTSSFVGTHTSSSSDSSFWSKLNKKKEKYVKSITNNELENYLECEFVFSEFELENLDILKWRSSTAIRFSVISKMAKDLLMIFDIYYNIGVCIFYK